MDVAQDAPNTVFLAGDEAGLYLQATTCHVGSATGQTPIVRADPGLKSQNEFLGCFELAYWTRTRPAFRSDEC